MTIPMHDQRNPTANPQPDMSKWVIGIDVGGTKIAGGVVNVVTGAISSRRIIPTAPERGGEAVLDDAVSLAADLRCAADRAGHVVTGIGIGVAELVDVQGTIQSNHVIGWYGLPIHERFAAIAPVTIEADVRAAACAEARFGTGRSFRTFAYITVGTGISSCLVLDGKPYPGARGNALVLASGPLDMTCSRCGARSRSILEEIASGPALASRYGGVIGHAVSGAEEVTAAAASGDPAAREIVESAGAALGNSAGLLVNILDPGALIVGGGLGVSGGLYWESLVTSIREHIWSSSTRELPILPAAFKGESGLIGAALATCLAP